MKRSKRVWTGVVAALITLVSSASADDKAREVEPSKLPEAIRQAAAKASPGIRLSKAYTGVEEGKTLYLLQGKDAKGREVSIEAEQGGKIQRVVTTIAMADVPEKIRKIAERDAKASVGKIVRVKSVVEAGDPEPIYEFEGPVGGPENRVMTFLSAKAAERRGIKK